MAVKKTSKSKKKIVHQASVGNLYIQATYNNTIATATDLNGNTLAWASSGNCGFKGPKKATPYASSVLIRQLADKLASVGLKEVHVFVKGIGGGRDSAVRSLNTSGFNVLSLKDLTPIPHNGCRAPKPRRM
ncbi:TPA: 30S ribosomal protein S11 [Candidatus Uhrbacteria bacterium]|uniref:Small ribosomal subunit protein uS11 n=1 Tax=Candidatus Uhrbacteria bacterium GW2011_GWC2_53_7 TaxID=1618986 RepID=A0A0G2AS65_9BACT|nr:MAG: 30S ribosomal protein S11 [Candidatus Uhrbacteria bacterium GW2011_GWC2_53_7]OGL72614.1 MAG: 30S ribosomal protein S11 [Candidatus Uhrbacteria bacterium RIFCSPHIGHO2_02_FULL_54_11]HBL39230.1 30S ribosomal protein S11 [Candidatus Uhrbacteria bacterium]